MQVSLELFFGVVGGAATVTTAIFWGSFYLGKMWSRLERVEQRLEDHVENSLLHHVERI